MSGRKSWDQYFMGIAHAVAERSTCDRKHVGCVLVSSGRVEGAVNRILASAIISTGYNGSIPKEPHCDDEGHDMQDGHCVRTIHAESNAVAQAARMGVRTWGAVAYVNTYPCWSCFRLLASAGVIEIVYDDEYRTDPRVYAASRTGLIVRSVRG